MPLRKNPFQQVYLTELIPEEQYAQLFSPLLINEVLAVFQPGNIILEGVQGSGKSMLLTLLKPEIRIAYQRVGLKFPVPIEFSNFIGAGINLIRCAAIDFGGLIREGAETSQSNIMVNLFGDFINYLILDDILDSIETYNGNEILRSNLCINMSTQTMKHFVDDIANQGCWFGYFNKLIDYHQLRKMIRDRIQSYRVYLMGYQAIDSFITETLTSPGEPISQIVRSLRKSGVISEDVEVFVRIDQCEEMVRLEAKLAKKSCICSLMK